MTDPAPLTDAELAQWEKWEPSTLIAALRAKDEDLRAARAEVEQLRELFKEANRQAGRGEAEVERLREEVAWLRSSGGAADVYIHRGRRVTACATLVAAYPVGLSDIADRLGVARQTAKQWKLRGLLPEPKWTVGGRPAWDWSQIEEWARETGRLDE